jgi:hypothetical protein
MRSLADLQAQIAQLKAAGAPQIAPEAWAKLTEDFQHVLAELQAARADGKLWIGEVWGLAMDMATVASDVAALVAELFPKPAK